MSEIITVFYSYAKIRDFFGFMFLENTLIRFSGIYYLRLFYVNMNKPFLRIIRPSGSDLYGWDHYFDSRYCSERHALIHAYHIIQSDLKKIFDYIELHDNNKKVFSHRIYDLFLRSCTEFENNCIGILKDNTYTRKAYNIRNFFKINDCSKLNEYEVKLNIWSPEPLIFKPFEDWKSSEFTSLQWYKDYNSVKHNRSKNFALASLENLIKSIGGLFVILVSQFYIHAFNPYQKVTFHQTDDDGFLSTSNNFFSIKLPSSWGENDFIIFDWKKIRTIENPFEIYKF